MLSRNDKNKPKTEPATFVDYFLLFSGQIERSLKIMISLLFLCLVLTQIFLFSNEDHHALVNKAIHYEGVFQEDPIKVKATLQR